MVTLSLPPGPFDLIHSARPQLDAFNYPPYLGNDLAASSVCCSHIPRPLVQHRTRKGWSLEPASFLDSEDTACTRRDGAAGAWALSGWAGLGTDGEDANGDSDEENPSLPSLSSSRTSSSDDEDDASSTSSEDYFQGFGRTAAHIDRHAALSTATSMLFQSAPVPEPTSPSKRSALSPPSGRRRRSAKRSLTSPPAMDTFPRANRLPDLVVTSLRRSQPLLPTVQLVSAFEIDLPVASASSRRQVDHLDLVDELDLNLGAERTVDELPWEWDCSAPIECPASPSRRPACLDLAPPPAPPTVSKSPKPRLVANTAQLLMLSLEATMVRTGKIVSPLRQRQVVVRHGRAEVGSTLRTEVV